MPTTSDHRLAEQIASYTGIELPDYVQAVATRIKQVSLVDRPLTHTESMLQSKRGHENPGPGKSVKTFGRKT